LIRTLQNLCMEKIQMKDLVGQRLPDKHCPVSTNQQDTNKDEKAASIPITLDLYGTSWKVTAQK
jgi:hypothetical protein